MAAQHQPESPLISNAWGNQASVPVVFPLPAPRASRRLGRPLEEHFGAQAVRCWLALRAVLAVLDTHTDTDQKELDSVSLDLFLLQQ